MAPEGRFSPTMPHIIEIMKQPHKGKKYDASHAAEKKKVVKDYYTEERKEDFKAYHLKKGSNILMNIMHPLPTD